ncbi:putative ribonuclease H-like domain-containing protein [Tanacetum coccineum]
MDDLIRDRNAKLAAFQQDIDTLKETLSNNVKEKESLSKTLTIFKIKSKEKESKYIGEYYLIKSLSEKDSLENVKKDIDKIETINIELEHSVAKLLSENENLRKEQEHLKSIYKDQFDSIRKTRVQSKEHCDSLIAQINAKSVENSDLNAQLQEKVFANAALKNELRKLKGKYVVDTAVSKPNATITSGMFKLDIKPISHKLQNYRDAHEIYIDKTIENTDTLNGFVERARIQNPTKPSEKLVAVTPMNKDKRVRFAEPVTSLSNIPKQTGSLKTKDSNKPLLTSTGVKPTTSASGSKPSSNTKNNRIMRPPSSNQKNKVEDHSRKVKSSLNKMNSVSKPISNALVKHSMRNARNEMRKVWKPTGKVFSEIRYSWKPTENGNLFNLVVRTTTNADGTSTLTIPGPVTTEEKNAKTLIEAIQTIFGGNDAIKKTQKTLLKQIYENFNALSTESLDSQKIVSQLAILGENLSQEDINLKFLRIMPSEWNTHVMVWRNKPDLDSMSFEDIYNNFKIVEQEVKRTVTSSSNSGSQNMAFVSTPSISTDSTANLSDATVYAFLTNQPNGSQLVHEDLEQIHEDDLEEMDLKWQLALLSMRARRYYQRTGKKITTNRRATAGYDNSKVECFNYHKMGHFARECRGLRNQESSARNQDSSRRTVNVEDISSKAMMAIDGAGFH